MITIIHLVIAVNTKLEELHYEKDIRTVKNNVSIAENGLINVIIAFVMTWILHVTIAERNACLKSEKKEKTSVLVGNPVKLIVLIVKNMNVTRAGIHAVGGILNFFSITL